MRNLREAFRFYAKGKKDSPSSQRGVPGPGHGLHFACFHPQMPQDAIWAPTVCKALRWLGHPLPLDDVLRLIGEASFPLPLCQQYQSKVCLIVPVIYSWNSCRAKMQLILNRFPLG